VKKTLRAKLDLVNAENTAKAKVRKRDRFQCRFPMCGCRKLKLRLEVSHDQHKGMGGNPKGDRSVTKLMVLLCVHRHQHGQISRHAGTLEAQPLTQFGYDGPVAWKVKRGSIWFEVARESAPGVLLPLAPRQLWVLEDLAEMEQ
jgi:hypothetical protein